MQIAKSHTAVLYFKCLIICKPDVSDSSGDMVLCARVEAGTFGPIHWGHYAPDFHPEKETRHVFVFLEAIRFILQIVRHLIFHHQWLYAAGSMVPLRVRQRHASSM